MAWIELPDDQATPELARLTQRYRNEDRPVPAVMQVLKATPKTFRAVVQMNMAVTFGGSTLGQLREELIATSVSALNGCFY